MYDVVIIGAGAAGYGCAITLASANEKFEWAKNKKYLIIDDNNSDILKASFYNLTGVEFGINGDELLNNMKQQLQKFPSCKLVNDTVTKIEQYEDGYKVISNNKTIEANVVVIATGMHTFDIECRLITVLPHNDVLKPNKICLENKNNKIVESLFVAGLASGVKTMFAIANADGVKVACDILKLYSDKLYVPHDVIKHY